MRFYAETFVLSVAGGVVFAVSWWAETKLGINDGHVTVVSLGLSFGFGIGTGLVIAHRRWLRAVNEKIAELRGGKA